MNIHTFSLPDGGTLRWTKTVATAPSRGTVFLLPGWGEWIEKYEDILAAFNTRGHDTVLLEWRGQGLSSRFTENSKKSWLPSFDFYISDLDVFFRKILASEKNVVLFAHSMGAHLGLRWFLEMGRSYGNIGGIILSSIMMDIHTGPFLPLCAARAIANTAVFFGLGEAYAPGQANFDQASISFEENLVTSDMGRYNAMLQQLLMNPALKVGGITFAWLAAAFESSRTLEDALKRGCPHLPYLVMGTEKDLIVRFEGITRTASYLPQCATYYVKEGMHELLQEKDSIRNGAWEAIDTLLARTTTKGKAA